MQNAARFQYLDSIFTSMRGDNIYLQTPKGRRQLDEWVALKQQLHSNKVVQSKPKKANGVTGCGCGGKYKASGQTRHEKRQNTANG